MEPGIHRDSGDRLGYGREPIVNLLEARPDIRVTGEAGTASARALEGCGRQPECGTQQLFMLHAGRRDPVISPCPLSLCGLVSGQYQVREPISDGLPGCPGMTVTAAVGHLMGPMQARAWTIPRRALFVPHARRLAAGAASTLPWGQIKDQSPLCDAVPGRFTGVVFVAEERHLDAGADAAQARLANLRRGGALIISSVDCYRAGYERAGPARPTGLATPSPDGAGSRPVGASWAERRRK